MSTTAGCGTEHRERQGALFQTHLTRTPSPSRMAPSSETIRSLARTHLTDTSGSPTSPSTAVACRNMAIDRSCSASAALRIKPHQTRMSGTKIHRHHTPPAIDAMKRLHILPEHLGSMLQKQRDGAREVPPDTAGDAEAFRVACGIAHLKSNKRNHQRRRGQTIQQIKNPQSHEYGALTSSCIVISAMNSALSIAKRCKFKETSCQAHSLP